MNWTGSRRVDVHAPGWRYSLAGSTFGNPPPSQPSQGTRLAQYACACGSRPSAESRLASVTWISPGQRLGLEEERGPAAAAEAARGRRGRFVAGEQVSARDETQRILGEAGPGDEPGALRPPAHRAVAMRDPQRHRPDAVPHPAAQAAPGSSTRRDGRGGRESRLVRHITRTFLNCQGSVSSRSSGNSRLRSTSGCHSVYSPTTRPRYGRQISRIRL